MPFDLAKFEEIFGIQADKYSLDHMMTDFQEETAASTDEFAVFRAVIATKDFNSNYIYLDEDTLQNIARQSNRDTAGDDIPIYPNHNRYDFQIGTMLTAKYHASRGRVEGTFNIIRDPETEILINRINNRVVRDVSPTIMGEIECDLCGDGTKMYRWGGCKNDHYLGEKMMIDGKERIVTGTFKDGKLVEVSVVSKGAFSNTVIFSENKELLEQALAEGIINQKALDMIEYSFSVDLGIKNSKPEPLPPEPEFQPKPEGVPPMSKPTDADIQLMHDENADLKQQVADKDAKIADFQAQLNALPTVEQYEKHQNDLAEANRNLIEKDAKLAESDTIVSEYQACVQHVREKAIEFYAKTRGVEVDNTTDLMFVRRKGTLEKSNSLTYLISALEHNQNSYYSTETQFGGRTTRSSGSEDLAPVNPNHFDI